MSLGKRRVLWFIEVYFRVERKESEVRRLAEMIYNLLEVKVMPVKGNLPSSES